MYSQRDPKFANYQYTNPYSITYQPNYGTVIRQEKIDLDQQPVLATPIVDNPGSVYNFPDAEDPNWRPPPAPWWYRFSFFPPPHPPPHHSHHHPPPFHPHFNPNHPHPPPHRMCWFPPSWWILIAIILTVVISTVSFFYEETYGSSSDINFTLKRSGYSALDYFDEDYDSVSYSFLSDYTAILEPYQPMELHVYDSSDRSGYFEYYICPSSDLTDCSVGKKYSNGNQDTVTFECSPYDEYYITLYKATTANRMEERGSGKVLCLYVRREIRDLTDTDYQTFINSSYQISLYSDDEGQSRFGSDFHNMTYISKFHFFSASQQDCDHIHEGNGFLLQHLKLTYMFDASLRAVDPSQSLPYWDFTIDATDGLGSYNNVLYVSDGFGEILTPMDLISGYQYAYDTITNGRIYNGKWANLTVTRNSYYPTLNYGYGFLRSPWGMNPSPYLSRFAFDFQKPMPSCSDHYDLLEYTDMMDFFVESSYAPHASVHSTLGGFYGCDVLNPLVAEGYIKSIDYVTEICGEWDFIMKESWRKNYIIPRNNCAIAEPIEDSFCGYDCPSSTKSDLMDFVLPQISLLGADTDKENTRDVWLAFICGGDGGKIFVGDHLESSSAEDPSFWVIHPTLERLLHAKLLAGGFETEDWTTDSVNDFVCNHPDCYSSTDDNITYRESCCYGHYEDDQLLDAINGDASSGSYYTNAEMLSMVDPRTDSYSMPYIYDHFKWSHCKERDFTELLEELIDNATEYSSSSSGRRPMNPRQIRLREYKQMIVEEMQMRQGFRSSPSSTSSKTKRTKVKSRTTKKKEKSKKTKSNAERYKTLKEYLT
jgi:hypothetical protein